LDLLLVSGKPTATGVELGPKDHHQQEQKKIVGFGIDGSYAEGERWRKL
jgi:hypothetical protein